MTSLLRNVPRAETLSERLVNVTNENLLGDIENTGNTVSQVFKKPESGSDIVQESSSEPSSYAEAASTPTTKTGITPTATIGPTLLNNAYIAGPLYHTRPVMDTGQKGVTLLQDTSSLIEENTGDKGISSMTGFITGTADMTGAAVTSAINASIETSGKVFQPVNSGLKAVEVLESLGEGIDNLNGLSMDAVKQVNISTRKAMNMGGTIPTFFDSDADGIVKLEDTRKGLISLGLQDDYANYAAYALHLIFSFSTSNSWIPSLDRNLPVNISKMNNTRWGKNWGTYERVSWCFDINIETFFEGEESTGLQKWKKMLKKSRQYFGFLMLIFEWGTTWPFYMPTLMPDTKDIPYMKDMGRVIRMLILPTIMTDYRVSQAPKSDKT